MKQKSNNDDLDEKLFKSDFKENNFSGFSTSKENSRGKKSSRNSLKSVSQTKDSVGILGKGKFFLELSISLVLFLLPAVTFYAVWQSNFIPNKYLLLLAAALLLFNIIIVFMLFGKGGNFKRYLALVLVLMAGGVMYFGMDALHHVNSTIDKISTPIIDKKIISLLVKEDDSINYVDDLGDTEIAYIDEQTLTQLSKILGKDYKTGEKYIAYPQLVEALLNGKERVVLFDEAFRAIINDLHPKFAGKTRILTSNADEAYLKLISEEAQKVNKDDPVSSEKSPVNETILETSKPQVAELKSYEDIYVSGLEPFTFYVSGMDNYGGISSSGRSDVNIVGAVNPKTHRIVLIHVPRDSYLPIAGTGGHYDKLTHAGLLGINSSMATVESLMNTDVSVYMKVNFNSVIDIVDTLGGITVNNPVTFSSRGHYFLSGNIRLNGEQALWFSRERYSFASGDLARGQNQLRVIKGIVNEAIRPANLMNYGNLLNTLSGSFRTNLSNEAISNLVNGQIDSGAPWSISSVSLSGSNRSGLYSHFMPGYNLYFLILDQGTVHNARAAIQDVLNG